MQQCLPFTVLKLTDRASIDDSFLYVATVLTVYGIETHLVLGYERTRELQQSLPFTVLKLEEVNKQFSTLLKLQQCLPFTVLKQALTPLGVTRDDSCNSAYRLRY